MIVIGAGGSAKDLLVVIEESKVSDLFFYDDVNLEGPSMLFDKYPILKSEEEIRKLFAKGLNSFIVAIGHPRLRAKLFNKLVELGGNPVSVISQDITLGNYTKIAPGTAILPGCRISNNVTIGKSCYLGVNSVFGHDCRVGEFNMFGPGASFLGQTSVGDYCYIGANATVLPKVTLGNNVYVNAGKVVDESVPDYKTFD
ncbi:MAG: DapH/DapD/GlmU-related protein [Bacteroidota bacterium]